MNNQTINNMSIPIYLGQIDNWQDTYVDLTQIQHLLISGYPGCGKSTLIHNIISKLISQKSDSDIKLLLYDSKGIELHIYNPAPHMFLPTVTSDKLDGLLSWCVAEIKRRLSMFVECSARDIVEYNEKAKDSYKFPYLVLVLDGYSSKTVHGNLHLEEILLTGRSAGIYIILSTVSLKELNDVQHLFASFAVFKSSSYPRIKNISSQAQSLKLGEFLYIDALQTEPLTLSAPEINFSAIANEMQKCFQNQEEAVVKNKHSSPLQLEELDEYFVYAGKLVMESNNGSIGMLQRKFKIGFNRAEKIMNQLAMTGVVGFEEGIKPRKVLMSSEQFETMIEDL